MRTTTFVLCESARLKADGSVDIVGAGLSEVVVEGFPAKVRVSCVAMLDALPVEAGKHELEIWLRDPHGRRLQSWRHSFALGAGQKGAHIVLNLREASLPAEGEYLFELRVDGRHEEPTKSLRARTRTPASSD